MNRPKLRTPPSQEPLVYHSILKHIPKDLTANQRVLDSCINREGIPAQEGSSNMNDLGSAAANCRVLQSPPKRKYRPDIDGIRAIAILSVIFYHGGVPLISGGFTGVDIFFVISGYLIGGHILSDLLTGTFSYWNFYRLRAKRILPAFYAVLTFTILERVS